MLHDLGWVCQWPLPSLVAICFGIGLQAKIAWTSCSSKDAHAVNQCCILCWLLGNLFWTWGELMWEEETPVGLLQEVEFMSDIDRAWYVPVMVAANCLMLPTCVVIVTFYLLRWVYAPCQSRPWHQEADAEAVEAADVAYACLPCLPVDVYYELFIVPWLLMDSTWALMNLLELWIQRKAVFVLIFSTVAGCTAVSLQCDSLRRQCCSGRHSWRDLAMIVAELVWVFGNIVWMVSDETLDKVNHVAVATIFCPATLVALMSACWPGWRSSPQADSPMDTPLRDQRCGAVVGSESLS